MEKILSVCIPSYNMEKFLRRNLDSFIASGCLDELELIVVNDGSKDSTLQIANEYKSLYPNTVVVIDKPNGHYGSCINAALKVASGKYFRIVDADDWVDSDNLKDIIALLCEQSVDVVYTKFSIYYAKTGKFELQKSEFSNLYNQKMVIEKNTLNHDFMHMHCLTYSTSLLRNINYTQTEGICYTDTEYVFIPLIYAKTLYCIDKDLYQYYIGRNDQSMAKNVLIKNYEHIYKILIRLINESPDKHACQLDLIRSDMYNTLLRSFLLPITILYSNNPEYSKKTENVLNLIQQQGNYIDNIDNYRWHGINIVKLWRRGNILDIIFLNTLRFLLNLNL